DMYTKEIKAQNEAATVSKLNGFVPNTDNVKSEVTACVSAANKYSKTLQTGENTDAAALCAKILADQKANGLDKILADFQKQVDAFLAAK
ncbi:MAG: DUF3502 domain-containing protein, partial [Oscillospiraceae bacterium]